MAMNEKKNKNEGPGKGFVEKGKARGEFDVMEIGKTSAEGAKKGNKIGVTKD